MFMDLEIGLSRMLSERVRSRDGHSSTPISKETHLRRRRKDVLREMHISSRSSRREKSGCMSICPCIKTNERQRFLSYSRKARALETAGMGNYATFGRLTGSQYRSPGDVELLALTGMLGVNGPCFDLLSRLGDKDLEVEA